MNLGENQLTNRKYSEAEEKMTRPRRKMVLEEGSRPGGVLKQV